MLHIIDWLIIIGFLAAILFIGLSYRKQSATGLTSFFLGGRNLPWYLAGLSMVATTFAADTPLAVTELVGQNGISGNWLWWNLLAGGMLTTFFFANLWRRANIVTEVEFIELRYSGKPAAFLRGFKALYLGLFMNVLIIGWVNLAMITILQGFFGISYQMALFYTALMLLFVAFYAALSGLMGVVVTDAIQFVLAMTGSIILAYLVINAPEVGGISGLKQSLPEGTLNFLPSLNNQTNGEVLNMGLASFLAFFGFVWWASWYPGAEPGGGGYIAQRMMSTKNEKHAVGATLFFQIAHYCLRPWPWILVGLAAITIYAVPKNIGQSDVSQEYTWFTNQGFADNTLTLSDADFEKEAEKQQWTPATQQRLQHLRTALKVEIAENPRLGDAITYAADKRFGYVFAMRDFLPKGLLGLLLAAFFAAFMSTISTQLNWGASYLVNDGYKRFIHPEASEKRLIKVSRGATVLLMLLGLAITFYINSISAVWRFIMECGAGLGLVLILRWYWWRINAYTEIAATIAPFIGYALAHSVLQFAFPNSFFFTVGFTTVAWLATMWLTKPEPNQKLSDFVARIQPEGWWHFNKNSSNSHQNNSSKNNLINLAFSWITAVGFTYSMLFFIGKLILQIWVEAGLALLSVALFGLALRFFISRSRIFG